MSKKWSFYIIILVTATYLSAAFKPLLPQSRNCLFIDDQKVIYQFPSQFPSDYLPSGVPYTGRYFIGFREAVAFKESQGEYRKVSSRGYLGKYQFGTETLRTVGIINDSRFLRSPKLQEKAFIALLSKNKWKLRNEIERFAGQIIAGVPITESGILAAAHLGGVGSVKRFLNSNGKRKCKDNFGTSIACYMRDFAGYETRAIIADSEAKAL